MRKIILTLLIGLLFWSPLINAQVSLSGINSTYTQDFNTLSSLLSSSTTPTGWSFLETGSSSNSTYSPSNGSDTAGNTYSYGSALASDRAFGELSTGGLNAYIGAELKNNTGYPITSLAISYQGEQWRLGGSGKTDTLIFEYSTNATSLSTGTWTRVNSLDFTSMVTSGTAGALNGNSPSYSSTISGSVTGLNVSTSSTVWIRWRGIDVSGTGEDDGLAVDDVSITPGTTSGESDIIEDTLFAYPTNINYLDYVGGGVVNMSTSNSIAIASFTIRDGGATGNDIDVLKTTLDQLRISMDYPGFIYALGVFDGSTKISQVYQNITTPGSILFNNLNISAPDNGTKTFTLRAVFFHSVIDQRQIRFSILSATTSPSSSKFSSANAGGASTTVTGAENKIQVIAQRLAFTNQPSPTAYLNTDLLTPPVITAQDTLGNTDRDFSGTITIGNTANGGMSNFVSPAISGQATFHNLNFSQRAYTKLYTTNTSGLINDTSIYVTVKNAPQKRWDGGAGTSNWNDSANWKPDGVPDAYDSVVLDNNYIAGNYTVNVNVGNQKIAFLTLRPYGANNITLNIPSSVTADTALEVRGKYGFPAVKIKSNGIIKNAGTSVTSGSYPFAIDSGYLNITTGGAYIHATLAEHNDLVDKLFLDPTTLKGIFMFDVPGTSTYDLSINNKTFGTLSLQRSSGSGTYTGSGSGKLTMLGELQVGENTDFKPSIDSILIQNNIVVSGLLSPDSSTWIVLDGTEAQDISGSGIYDVKKMEFNNTSGLGITLSRPFSMSNTVGSLLKFTNGILYTSNANILTLPRNANAIGGSYKSFVDGPMVVKTDNTLSHLAPVGSDSFYRAVVIAPISTDTTTFNIEYHHSNPNTSGYTTTMRDPVLKSVSTVEFWSINRTNIGSPADAYITLFWSTSSGVNAGYVDSMRVALWNGSKWADQGASAITGNADYGSVTTQPEATSFGIFTLASVINYNTLPVEMINFTASMNGDFVKLDWNTASELNNRGFYVQRSYDGRNWETLNFINGSGTTQMVQTYSYNDYTVSPWGHPIAYYRLKQVDFNGSFEFSNIAKVKFGETANLQKAWFNSSSDQINVIFDKPIGNNTQVRLIDLSGRTIYYEELKGGETKVLLNVPEYKEGIHILNIIENNNVTTSKIYLSK